MRRKNYYAFAAFKALLDPPHRVEAAGGEPGKPSVLAGVNRENDALNVLVGNLKSKDDRLSATVKNLPWDGPSDFELLVVDAGHDLSVGRRGPLPDGGRIDLPAASPAVLLLKVRKAKPRS